MGLVYFDASALVKLMVEEDGTDIASDLWDGCDAALSSRFAYPEVRAALAASHRNSQLTKRQLRTTESNWELFWDSMRPVELTASVELHAGELARRRSLRGADAVHLASALAVDSPGLVIAVWDRRLHAAAVTERLAVAPATLGD